MVLIMKQLIIIFLSLNILACTSVSAAKNHGFKETGKASFYADKFQGRKTASGAAFNQKARTAAHKKLPFGTKVKVTNLNNGKDVVVVINDRGPFIKGRIIDLSRSAFTVIGNINSGVIKVRIEVLD